MKCQNCFQIALIKVKEKESSNKVNKQLGAGIMQNTAVLYNGMMNGTELIGDPN